ncbi:MAG: ABC transporter permease subunit [bacterium]|nr:ABC transporter permease subunit [bacterium]
MDNVIRQAPSSFHTVRAIARRQLLMARKRKLVKLLFLGSLLPPLILIIVIIVRNMAEQATGMTLGWDPLMRFLEFQALPVGLLALGLGIPSVARDRAEDVLFLYATRPVQPWHYALGKLLAVALPCTALMLLPGVIITLLHLGVTSELNVGEALVMILKMTTYSVLMGAAYAGVTVGASSGTKKSRWALLITLAIFSLPDTIVQLAGVMWNLDVVTVGPQSCLVCLQEALLNSGPDGWWCALALTLYGLGGMWITLMRVKKEMIP